MTNIKKMQENEQLSNKRVAKEIGTAENDLNHLYNSAHFATPSELTALRDFVEKN